MMKSLSLAFVFTLLVFSACGKKEAADARSAAAPVNKYCMVEPQHEIDPKVTLVHEGKTYAFCCKDCIATFKEDPGKYIVAFESREKKGI